MGTKFADAPPAVPVWSGAGIFMIEKIGFCAGLVLVGATMALLAAGILWPVTAIAHLNLIWQEGALGLSALFGLGFAIWLGVRAGRLPPETPPDDASV